MRITDLDVEDRHKHYWMEYVRRHAGVLAYGTFLESRLADTEEKLKQVMALTEKNYHGN